MREGRVKGFFVLPRASAGQVWASSAPAAPKAQVSLNLPCNMAHHLDIERLHRGQVTAAVQVAACVSPRPVPWLRGCGQSLPRIIRKQEAQLGLGILSLAKGHKGFAALIHRPDKASHFKKPSLLQMY